MNALASKLYKRITNFILAFVVATATLTAIGPFLTADSASALSTVTTVDKNNMNDWLFYNDETDVIDNTLGSFVYGPDTAPLGNGSVQLSVSGTQRRNIATYQFAGTSLADIDELSYETYNGSAGNGGSSSRSGYLQFNATFDGNDTWQKRLTYVPVNNGTVLQDTWQQWDAIAGGAAQWTYSGSVWPGTVISGTTPRSWSDILTSYPSAAIRTTDAFLGIRVGEPYADGYTENIDNFRIDINGNEQVYDFEPVTVPACSTDNTTFDTFSNGSVNGQNGWESTGPFDQAVVTNDYGIASFGCKSFRLSNAVTSGSFGDQTFSYSTPNEAGEADSTNGGESGGTRVNRYEAQFDIASTQATEQTGLSVSVSPDRGDGSRMSYLRFEDQADGIHVFFYDVQGGETPSFIETELTTLDRNAHTIKFVVDFNDGPSNDVVTIFIDGTLAHTGTSWEDYYRFDPESIAEQTPRTSDSLLFRVAGTAAPATIGNGFLFDNIVITTSDSTVVVPEQPTDSGSGTNTPATPAPTAASIITPIITSPASVLGTADNIATTGESDVEGTTDDKTATADNEVDGIILGLMWYWWILILAGAAGLTWWILAAYRRRNNEE